MAVYWPNVDADVEQLCKRSSDLSEHRKLTAKCCCSSLDDATNKMNCVCGSCIQFPWFESATMCWCLYKVYLHLSNADNINQNSSGNCNGTFRTTVGYTLLPTTQLHSSSGSLRHFTRDYEDQRRAP